MIKVTALAFYLLREQEVLPMAKNKKTRKVTVKKKQTAKRNQGMHRVPRENRKYKDTVFRMLFSEKEEDRWENSLSEAYENLTGEPKLELKVITLNINEGYNKELMEQCQILREYAQYVGKVRKYRKVMELDAAVEHAVDECIREEILKDFLQKNRVEVLKVSIFEYDQEEEEKKLRKAEFEAGYDTGVMDKVKEIIQYMLKSGEPVEKIARYTGYTVEEVKEIIKTSQ